MNYLITTVSSIAICWLCLANTLSGLYEIRNAKISFESNAPEEIIKASTSAMNGLLNITDNKAV